MISRKRLAFLSHTGSALASNPLKNIIWRWLELPGRVDVTNQASTTWPHRCLAGKRGNWGQTGTPNWGLPLQNQALDFTPRVLLLWCNRDNRYSAVNSVCFLAWCCFLLYQGLGFLCWWGVCFLFSKWLLLSWVLMLRWMSWIWYTGDVSECGDSTYYEKKGGWMWPWKISSEVSVWFKC